MNNFYKILIFSTSCVFLTSYVALKHCCENCKKCGGSKKKGYYCKTCNDGYYKLDGDNCPACPTECTKCTSATEC